MPRVSSGEAVKSAIVLDNFVDRMTSVFGVKRTEKPVTSIEKRTGLQFVKVDLGNPAHRLNKAFLGNVVRHQKMSTTLEKYFDAWLTDTTIGYEDVRERQTRLNELYFMYCNDAFIARGCHLVADEATQPDSQKRLIGIEAGDKAFVKATYELLNKWGVTQSRVNGTVFDINLFGEAFWLNKVTSKGVEAIKPLDPNIIKERLEFSPVKVADFLAKRSGDTTSNLSKMEKVNKLVDIYNTERASSEDQVFDIFDSKLFGYELEGNLFVPPWSITHFRYNLDRSEFFPYGRPPLLSCLAPFKLTLATKTLQGLARAMSFPLIVYKVKTSELDSPEDVYETVQDAMEQYDAISFNPAQASNEVYALNTKVWIPENYIDVEVKEMKIDLNLTDDLDRYQDQTIVGAAIPKGYLVQEWGGFGNSAISLVEQYKPFSRYVFTTQNCFLEELGWLIRLHYAITGEFDYNTPFVLTMRFPAEEYSEETMNQKTSNINLCKEVIDMVKVALGVSEDETLPEEVLQDILNQYSFLDMGYLSKWAQSVSYKKFLQKSEEDDEDYEDDEGGRDFDNSDGDFGGGGNTGGGGFGGFDSEPPAEDEGGEVPEETDSSDGLSANMEAIVLNRKRYREMYNRSNDSNRRRLHEQRVKKLQRFKELRDRYKESASDIFVRFLESENIQELALPQYDGHLRVVPKIQEGTTQSAIIQTLTSQKQALRESEAKTELGKMFESIKESQQGPDPLKDFIDDQLIKNAINNNQE